MCLDNNLVAFQQSLDGNFRTLMSIQIHQSSDIQLGMTPNYYPNTWTPTCPTILLLLGVIGLTFGIWCALLQPCLDNSLTTAWVFVGCFIAYIVIIVIAIFIGGRERFAEEKRMIEQKLASDQRQQQANQ